MSLPGLQLLFEGVTDSGLLPPASELMDRYQELVSIPPVEAVSRIKSHPFFAQYAGIVRDIISDMTNEEIANALIPYLEIYYPDMIHAIDESAEAASNVGAILTAIFNDIRGA